MPCVFNFEMNFSEAKKLWEGYLNVKINCPSLDLAKYFILIEDILNKFEILTTKSKDINLIRLRIDKDYSLIPKKDENSISNLKIKKLQGRISEKEGKENVLRDLGIKSDKIGEGASTSVEGSLNKILEIKDWKKAKYDFNQMELKKIREGRRKEDAKDASENVENAENVENVENVNVDNNNNMDVKKENLNLEEKK